MSSRRSGHIAEAKQFVPNLHSSSPLQNVNPETMLQLFETMVRIRRFEETAADLFESGKVKGTAHSYAGQEAIAAGTSLNLGAEDYVGSYHRGHGHCIAKGARTDRMMAELLGRSTGYCGGLGGSMHVADLSLNILGANGIVGAAMPIGAGAALASKLRASDAVVVAYFGDGAANQGVFHESLNLAAVWRLPMIFICENNQYALNTAFSDTTSVDRIAMRAASYGLSGKTIDGNDAVEVYQVVGDAIEAARKGGGPSLIEAMTWRWGPHSMRDNLREPRSTETKRSWEERDPIVLIENRLAAQGQIWRDRAQEIRVAVNQEIEAAVVFSMESPEPEPEILTSAVYAPHLSHIEPAERGTRKLTYTDALNEGLAQEMERDPSVFLMGEDIAETGGIFQVTKGLVESFGRDRVRDTPISEAAFCGAGVGAAIAGMRPVVEVQIFDFVTQMMDMIVNQAAKYRFMNGGAPQVPLVVRGPQGGGIRLAAQHSQCLEAWFTHVPGLVVVAPSTPFDAKGLLISAIRDNNPVIFLEHKRLYVDPQTGPVPRDAYAIPIGRGDIKRVGSDVTIVATQVMVGRALAAAAKLERDGISVEVIDPRTLKPLDEEMILSSVRKTNRLIVVHEGATGWGFGAEVSALVMEKAFDWLDAPVVRIGAPDVPIPFNYKLESLVIPSVDRIVEAARGILA